MFGARERGLAESSGAEAVIELEREGHEPGFADSGFLRILGLLTRAFLRKLVEEDTFTPPNRILSFLHLFIYICKRERRNPSFHSIIEGRGRVIL